MTEWPEWMKLPHEMWNDKEVLDFVKAYRGESGLPALYPLTLDEFKEWLESKGRKSDMILRALKYWLNEYHKEMQSAEP